MAQLLFDRVQEMLEEGEDISEYLFAFDPNDRDRTYAGQIVRGVRALLGREETTPREAWSLAKLLLGVRRLPLITPGLDISIELRPGTGGGTTHAIALSAEHLVATRGSGMEPSDLPDLEVDCSYRSDSEAADLAWLEELPGIAAAAVLGVRDFSDDAELDWDNDDGSGLWQHLPQLEDEAEGEEE